MIPKYLFELITQHIPEALAISFTATVFLNVKLQKKKILIIGFLHGFLVYSIRHLPLTFGFHTILSIFIITILFYYFYNKNSLESFIAILKAFILLTIAEVMFSFIIISFTGITVNLIRTKPLFKTIIMIPQNLFVFLIGLIIQYRRNKEKGE